MRMVLLTLLIVLAGCGEDTPIGLVPRSTEAPLPQKTVHVYVNDFGQHVEEVPVAEMEAWLAGNKDCEIVSITAVAMTRITQCNPTSGFLIVYNRKPKERL